MNYSKGKHITEKISDYVVVDIETTGLSPEYGDIIEIGAIKYVDNIVIEEFNYLIKPDYKISTFITSLTGITNEMVENQPKSSVILLEFKSFIEDFPLVVHNSSFDINFIYEKCIQNKIKPITNDYVDILAYARFFFPGLENYKLDTLRQIFNLKGMNTHRAIDDASLTAELLHYIYKNIDDSHFTKK